MSAPEPPMDAYDARLVPRPFGLHNTGSLCYLNAFLQVLAGCSAFTRRVLRSANYLRRTRTGAAVVEFCRQYASASRGGIAAADFDLGMQSTRVRAALLADLAERRPHIQFRSGQECSGDALDQLLDMMQPPDPSAGPTALQRLRCPVRDLFLHRYAWRTWCSVCADFVTHADMRGVDVDESHTTLTPFWFEDQKISPDSPSSFSRALSGYTNVVTDYACPRCKQRVTATRYYTLVEVPEILFCMFNIYNPGHGGQRYARYFPPHLGFRSHSGGIHLYRLVGQIEHVGSEGGGHYRARALRQDGKVYEFDDTGVSPSVFTPIPGTYIIAYHYTGHRQL